MSAVILDAYTLKSDSLELCCDDIFFFCFLCKYCNIVKPFLRITSPCYHLVTTCTNWPGPYYWSYSALWQIKLMSSYVGWAEFPVVRFIKPWQNKMYRDAVGPCLFVVICIGCKHWQSTYMSFWPRENFQCVPEKFIWT